MGIITLTDRISVRVSAKNTSQSNDYKKAAGGAIGKTLGNEDISDELKTQLGNTTKPVITDEDGNAWISMADIIAAGKAMNAAGAFEEKEIHDGLLSNGIIYNLKNVYPAETLVTKSRITSPYAWATYTTYMQPGAYWYKTSDSTLMIFSKAEVNQLISDNHYHVDYDDGRSPYDSHDGPNSGSTWSTTINGITYNIRYKAMNVGYTEGLNDLPLGGADIRYQNGEPISDVLYSAYYGMIGYLYGPVHTTGGSLIDWTKSDAEIEEDIRDLHETWDVSEHEGSVTANGTYVLAGPIEFNPADPTQGPPGSVG